MMRRLSSIVFSAALLLPLLAACGAPAAQPTAAPAAPTTAPAAATGAPAAATGAPTAPTEASVVEVTVPFAGGVLPEVDPAAVTGDIIAAGSSTVFPLTERMAELFSADGYTGQITVDSVGTGAGFERFCVNAETDIANASRPIKSSEAEACAAANRTVREFRVGTDALAVVVSSENDFVTNLTVEQLNAIYSGTAATWADVDPAFPAEPIQLFSPGTDSGTFDYFVEVVFDEEPAPLLAANPQLSEDDNVLVQGVEGSPYAIGYFGYAYYVENADRLKILDIEGVTPTEASTEDGSYPLSRPLFIYSADEVLSAKPQVADFINFYLTFVNDEVIDIGYFPASDVALGQAKWNWLAAAE
jgi:phosphate transport system substrate-binding protein